MQVTLSVSATFGYKAGNAGGFEGSGTIGLDVSSGYDKKWGSTTSEGTEFSYSDTITGPFVGVIEVVRSVDTMEVAIKSTPNFEHKIEIVNNGRVVHTWDSWNDLLNVFRGEAPEDQDLARAFTQEPMSDIEIHGLEAYIVKPIHFSPHFQNVNGITSHTVKDRGATDLLIHEGKFE